MMTHIPRPRGRLMTLLLHGALLTTVATLLSGCPLIVDWPPDDSPPRAQPFPDVDTDTPNEPWDADQSATGDVWQRQASQFPPVKGALVIGNVTGQTRVVRLRALRSTVEMDCDAIVQSPQLALRPEHFAPAQSWLVASGRAVPVMPRGKGACSAVLIDGTGLPRRLLFWHHTALQVASIPSTVAGAQSGGRFVAIAASEGEAVWGAHIALFPAPSLFDPVAPEGCAMPSQEQDLSWTALPSGNQTLMEVVTAPDGCSAMDLLTDLGVQRVYVCVPPGMLPFSAGDDVYIAGLATGHNVLPVTGVELLSDSGHIRMGRGTDIVYFGKGDAKIAVTQGCPALHDEVGTYARALSVTVQEPGKAAFQLDNGATLKLAGGGRLHLVRAIERLVWDTAVAASLVGNRHIESVWSKP